MIEIVQRNPFLLINEKAGKVLFIPKKSEENDDYFDVTDLVTSFYEKYTSDRNVFSESCMRRYRIYLREGNTVFDVGAADLYCNMTLHNDRYLIKKSLL